MFNGSGLGFVMSIEVNLYELICIPYMHHYSLASNVYIYIYTPYFTLNR